MGIFSNLLGTMSSFFQLGGPAGPRLNDNSGVVEAKTSDGAAYANINAANAVADTSVTTQLDLKHMAGIEVAFGFDGGTPPSAGGNTGKYGMCGKTGGSYTAGDIIYDTGSALQAITVLSGAKITTSVAVSGSGYTVTTIQNGLYNLVSASPNVWSLRGDGNGTGTGYMQVLGPLSVGTSATTDSTTSIPSGATILKTILNVTTPYSGGATIAATVNGSTPVTIMATGDNTATSAGVYVDDGTPIAIGGSNTGHVRVSVNGSPGAGASTLTVQYITAGLA